MRVSGGEGLGLGNQWRGQTLALALLVQVQVQVRTLSEARGLQRHVWGLRRKGPSLTLDPLTSVHGLSYLQ